MASEKIIKQKEEEVKKLAEKMKDASLVLLTDYRGITVADVTELRSTLRKINAEYYVIKNNITKRALNKNGITELDDKLVGPTAVIIAKEEYLPALKAVYAYSKDHDFYQMKSGVLDGKVSDVNELKTPKIDELRLPDLFYRVTSDSAIALKTLTIQQHLSSKKPEKQITSCF